MEQWARDSILRHNECMALAYQIVMQANGHCENSLSNKIADLLENYEIDPETGDFTKPGDGK